MGRVGGKVGVDRLALDGEISKKFGWKYVRNLVEEIRRKIGAIAQSCFSCQRTQNSTLQWTPKWEPGKSTGICRRDCTPE